jgi:hypothetical protein
VLIRLAAALLLAALLWQLFRFAMGLRYAKLRREQAREREEAQGRRVVAEIPLEDDLVLFVEDPVAFQWGSDSVPKAAVMGARLLLNDAVLAAVGRAGFDLPAPPAPDPDEEGRERWAVILYLRDRGERRVACGTLREGVSREIATQVFEALRRSLSLVTRGGAE